MAKSPQFPCYPRDLVADTVHLTTEQFGAYWRLCCAAWMGIAGLPQCYLPADDEETLARIAGVRADRWSAVGVAVKKLFGRDGDRYFSKRLLEELAKQKDRSARARESVEKRVTRPIVRLSTDQSNDNRTTEQNPVESQSRARAPVANANSSRQSAGASGVEEVSDLTGYQEAMLRIHPDPGFPDAVSRMLFDRRASLPPLGEFVEALEAWCRSEAWTKDGGKFATRGTNWIRDGGWKVRPRSRREAMDSTGVRLPVTPIDTTARLDALARSLPPALVSWSERIRSVSGDTEAIESFLSDLDREMVATAAASLDETSRHEIETAVTRTGIELSARLGADEVEQSRTRLRTQLLRRRLALPVLSLFSPEAQPAT